MHRSGILAETTSLLPLSPARLRRLWMTCLEDGKWESAESFRGVPGWGGLELGKLQRVAVYSPLCFTGTGAGTSRTLEPVTGGVAESAQGPPARTAPRRHGPNRRRQPRPQQPRPGLQAAGAEPPRQHSPLLAAGRAWKPGIARGSLRVPGWQGAGPESPTGRVTGARSSLACRGGHGP